MKRLSKGKRRSACVTEHIYEPEDEEITTQKVKFASLYEEDDDAVVVEDEQEEDGCALRQKHRKIWRISSIKNGANNQYQQPKQQERFVCSKCGKGFQSLKAKCGHMASHSVKEKAPSRNLVAKQKLAMDDSLSDTESGAQLLTRRSRRTRYKKQKSLSVVGSKAKVVEVDTNCSSEDSVVDQEKEEVAISLMMLSRDSANWGGLNSVGDSSDNTSTVLENRTVSTKLAQKDSLSTGYGADGDSKKFASKKVTALGDPESLFVRNFRISHFDKESKTEPHLSLNKLRRVMNAGMIRGGEGYNQTVRPKMDLYLKKSALVEPYITGYNAGYQYSNSEVYHNALINYQSHQDFNASVDSHRIFTTASAYGSGENSFETDASLEMCKGKGLLNHNLSNVGDKWIKGKHECPVCFKVFRSGQALGGHRRVHIFDGSDEISASYKLKGTQVHDSIDLNLPAPMEDDEASDSMGSYR